MTHSVEDAVVPSGWRHSDSLDELASALCAAQGAFESVGKDSTNPFFKSKYASLPAVVQAASPILADHGLSVCQLLGHDSRGDTLTTVLMHKSGQYIADTMHLRPIKDDPQAQGSATTYGRRYAYMSALGLVADEDDDGQAASAPRKAPRAAAPTLPKERVATLVDGLKLLGFDKNPDPVKLKLGQMKVALVDGLISKTLPTLTAVQANELQSWMEKTLDEQAAA